MYGAIIGDLTGSIYEYSQIKRVTPVICDDLIQTNSFISDDSILTIAILDAILNNADYEKYLKFYAESYKGYHPDISPYFKSTFSPGFTKWAQSTYQGKSTGNGAMMRISPVGYLYDNEEEIIKNTFLATTPSHNSKEAIKSATIVALIIYYARCGLAKEEIIKKLNLDLKTRKLEKFNSTCEDTLDICLYSLFTANNFEESLKKVLLYGGDTDTNACIVGSMAEAIYGIDEELITKANAHIPLSFQKKLTRGYERIKKYGNN